MAQELEAAIRESEWATLWKRYVTKYEGTEEAHKWQPMKWYKRYKKQLSVFSRDQMRVFIGIKTGHLKLKDYLYYRLHVVTDPFCDHCGIIENL